MVRHLDIAITSALILTTIITGTITSSISVEAEDIIDVTDTASVTVPASCSMTAMVESEHSASIPNGIYSGSSDYFPNGIGSTKIATFCNDNSGYAIYAIGYTGDKYDGEDHTKLIGATNGQKIATNTTTSGDASSWAMKLIKETDDTKSYNPTALTIENGYDNYNVIPDTYAKVANYTSTTDQTLGSVLSTTYAAYISPTQVADTYTGKVKYTLVHPNTEVPSQPQSCTTGKICYFANVSDYQGTMADQYIVKARDWSSCTYTDYESYCYDSDWNGIDINTLPELDTYIDTYTLLESNFSRTGYGFAGWSDKFDYATNPEAKFYGPIETITLNTADYTGTNPGLSLYAVWVKSQGNLQDSTKAASVCNSLTTAPIDGTANLSSVSALTDQRDNNTYAIAKLADGKCWMIENLRLSDEYSIGNNSLLAQGYNSSYTGLPNDVSYPFGNLSSSNNLYSIDGLTENTITGNNTSYRFPRYSKMLNNRDDRFSYGYYYSWAAAIADTSDYTVNNVSITSTSICPSGWHLPSGGDSTNTVNSDYWQLGTTIMGFAPANDSSYQPSELNTNSSSASQAFRAFPNNALLSGCRDDSYGYMPGVGTGCYWSSTTQGSQTTYTLYIDNENLSPGTYQTTKYKGATIRCLLRTE